jgi:CheY-like chemotaxis protein
MGGDRWSGKRVLVVEDNAFNQALVRGILGKKGWQIEMVESGELALSRLSEHTYDLVLMDVQMAAMDGLQTTMAVRASEVGMDGYVVKPIAVDKLFSEIGRVLV